MKTYVALLRGINVGGNKKVEMTKLKQVFEKLGFEQVSTYINSGNVIFSSKAVPVTADLEKVLKKTFGFAIAVVVRDAASILKVAKVIPKGWENNPEVKTDVLFLWDEYNKKTSLGLVFPHPEADQLKYVDGAIIWSINRKLHTKSGVKKFIGTPLYRNMTARNVNTVRKLASLMK